MTTWNLTGMQQHIFICNGGSCKTQGADAVTLAIREEIKNHRADSILHTTRTQCIGRCDDGCNVAVYPEGSWFKAVNPEIGRKIVSGHLLAGQPLEENLLYRYDNRLIPAAGTGEGTAKPS